MAEQMTLSVPKFRWSDVFEFCIDSLIVIAAGNLAAKFFLVSEVPITEQFTGFLFTLGAVGVAVKYVLSTRIMKRGV